MNLLEETTMELSKKGYTFEDVLSVQSKDYRISVDKFKALAAETNYDAGYGSQEVAQDLVILMNDGSWFARFEYDGAEKWQHYVKPEVFDHVDDDKVIRLADPEWGWEDLKEMNDKKEENVSVY